MRTSMICKSLLVRLGGRVRRSLGSWKSRSRVALTGVAILSGGMGFVGPAENAHAVDLIVNGGFENNNGFNGNNSGFGWFNDSDPFVFDVYSHATQSYNVGIDPPNSGDWYFHTVGINDATGVYQDMDLTAAATTAQIDAGTVTFDITAFLSGFGGQNDHARIEVTFADGGGAPIGGVATILDGGVEIAGDGVTLIFDSPDTFVEFIDPTVNPLNGNDRYLGWKKYNDLAGVPVGSRTARVTIFEDSKTGNGNDDYVENLSFDVVDSGVEQFLKIEVNKSSGAIKMINGSPEARDINFYEIKSSGGSNTLNNGWNSFADQMLDSLGANPVDNWQEGAAGSNLLTEAFLLGSSNFALLETQTLANAYSGGAGGAEDLIFQYGLANGTLHRGIVTYITSGALDGDHNGDGVVNAADYALGRDQMSSNFHSDFFNNFGGSLGSGSNAANVPEPTSFVLVVSCAGLMVLGIRRKLG